MGAEAMQFDLVGLPLATLPQGPRKLFPCESQSGSLLQPSVSFQDSILYQTLRSCSRLSWVCGGTGVVSSL